MPRCRLIVRMRQLQQNTEKSFLVLKSKVPGPRLCKVCASENWYRLAVFWCLFCPISFQERAPSPPPQAMTSLEFSLAFPIWLSPECYFTLTVNEGDLQTSGHREAGALSWWKLQMPPGSSGPHCWNRSEYSKLIWIFNTDHRSRTHVWETMWIHCHWLANLCSTTNRSTNLISHRSVRLAEKKTIVLVA